MPTTTSTLEERLTEVESIAGTFANNADYDEAMKLGKAYRESLRPKDAAQ
jgi:hypothetical protein